jgi:hypothetical protein
LAAMSCRSAMAAMADARSVAMPGRSLKEDGVPDRGTGHAHLY